jgi:hypothetical protein
MTGCWHERSRLRWTLLYDLYIFHICGSSAKSKICSFKRLPLVFPCQPITSCGGQKTHTVHFVDAQGK